MGWLHWTRSVVGVLALFDYVAFQPGPPGFSLELSHISITSFSVSTKPVRFFCLQLKTFT